MTDKTAAFEEGSGNVFADLGFDEADEHFARAQVGYHTFRIIKDRSMKQKDIAALLGISQPDVSHLMNGHFYRFSTDKLMEFLKRLDQKVIIQISPHHDNEPFQQVQYIH